jgi:hypothetical protein
VERGRAELLMRFAIALGVVGAAIALATPASAAAPNYILVSGRALAHPVLLADWNENADFLLALANAPRASSTVARTLRNRPRLDLAEFWGWSRRPRPRRAADANQHGTFYPAYRGRVAVITITVNGLTAPRIAPRKALRILARHGVPIRRG